jgi:hypothetical protein
MFVLWWVEVDWGSCERARIPKFAKQELSGPANQRVASFVEVR